MTQPLLELRDLRLERDGRTVLDGTNLVSSGDRIGLFGEGQTVCAAIYGEIRIAAGELRLCGVDLETARSEQRFGIARPWPNVQNAAYSFSVFEGLCLSAMLGGRTYGEARLLSETALERLGLAHFGRQRLGKRPGLEHYLAGLVEAALFEPEVVIVDWPIGVLTAEGWARYGTVLARLLSRRRWLAWVSGPARLPVEQAWIGALDQLFFLEGELAMGLSPGVTHAARTLVVLGVTVAEALRVSDQLGFKLEPTGFGSEKAETQAAFFVDLPRDEFGRPLTSAILDWCDDHQFPIFRLEVVS